MPLSHEYGCFGYLDCDLVACTPLLRCSLRNSVYPESKADNARTAAITKILRHKSAVRVVVEYNRSVRPIITDVILVRTRKKDALRLAPAPRTYIKYSTRRLEKLAALSLVSSSSIVAQCCFVEQCCSACLDLQYFPVIQNEKRKKKKKTETK